MTDNEPSVEKVKEEEVEDHVDPWTVASNSEAGVNYEKLIGRVLVYVKKKFLISFLLMMIF